MRRMTKIGLTLLLTLFVAISGSAQKKQTKNQASDLQTEIAKSKTKEANLKKEIEAATKELEKTKQQKKKTLNDVNLMDANIRNRQELIKTYNEQLDLLNQKISQGTQNINKMNGELDKLTEEYIKMVQFAYRYRNRYDQLEFLFASKDFNQAMQRMRYIQQFADARKTKIEQITKLRQQMNDELEANRKAMEEQQMLLAEQKAQQDILKKEKSELDAQVAMLKKEEDKLIAEINQKQKERKKLQNKLTELIRKDEEAKKAALAAAKSGKKNTGSTKQNTQSSFVVFDESEIATTGEFSKSKTKLAWPVEQVICVTAKFGSYPSPISSKVIIENNGISIKTTKNANARAVFDGVVALVMQDQPSNQCIIIRHGNYYTTYSQLDKIYVKIGDKVKAKQAIGRVHNDSKEGESILYFELANGVKYEDPQAWLMKPKK